MEQVLVLVAGLVLAAWIIKPLFGRRHAPESPPDPHAADLLEAKQSIYRSIVDLEMDLELGKISKEDYQHLKQEGKTEALGIIRELGPADEVQGPGMDAERLATLEDEIRAARSRMRKQ